MKTKPVKSVVFYVSMRPSAFNTGLFVDGETIVYVRAELRKMGALEALDKAKPKRGETILNSMDLE